MAHSIHMIIARADSAQAAAAIVKDELKGWGTDNNYFQICAIISEDGHDNDLEYPSEDWPNRWKLTFLLEPLEKAETHFNKAIEHIKHFVLGPIWLQTTKPHELYECNETSAVTYLADQIKAFNPTTSSPTELMRISNNCVILYNVLATRKQLHKNPDRFEFYGYEFDQYGLTDLNNAEGKQRYIVFIDMHS